MLILGDKPLKSFSNVYAIQCPCLMLYRYKLYLAYMRDGGGGVHPMGWILKFTVLLHLLHGGRCGDQTQTPPLETLW